MFKFTVYAFTNSIKANKKEYITSEITILNSKNTGYNNFFYELLKMLLFKILKHLKLIFGTSLYNLNSNWNFLISRNKCSFFF